MDHVADVRDMLIVDSEIRPEGAETSNTPPIDFVIDVPPGLELAVTAILTWVFAWNEYLFASTLTSVHARTITTGLAEFVTVTGTNWGQMAAVAMLMLLPAALVLALVQRYIVAGLTFGAVKG